MKSLLYRLFFQSNNQKRFLVLALLGILLMNSRVLNFPVQTAQFASNQDVPSGSSSEIRGNPPVGNQVQLNRFSHQNVEDQPLIYRPQVAIDSHKKIRELTRQYPEVAESLNAYILLLANQSGEDIPNVSRLLLARDGEALSSVSAMASQGKVIVKEGNQYIKAAAEVTDIQMNLLNNTVVKLNVLAEKIRRLPHGERLLSLGGGALKGFEKSGNVFKNLALEASLIEAIRASRSASNGLPNPKTFALIVSQQVDLLQMISDVFFIKTAKAHEVNSMVETDPQSFLIFLEKRDPYELRKTLMAQPSVGQATISYLALFNELLEQLQTGQNVHHTTQGSDLRQGQDSAQ